MPNKHIELVKRWLADKDSDSHEELRANALAATYAARAAAADSSAFYAAYAAAYGADAARAAGADDADEGADYWVNEYEALLTQRDLREAKGVESSYSLSYKFDDE